MDNRYIAVAEIIKPQHFYVQQNQLIFTEMLAMHTDGIPVDTVTLDERLRVSGKSEAAGGVAYLATLTDGMPRITNAAHYARIVHEKYELRDFIQETHRLRNRAWEGLASPDDLRAQIEMFLKSNSNGNATKKVKWVSFADFLAMDLPPVEYIMDPVVQAQGLTMIYAPPGMGKTFFSLEMAYDISCGVEHFGNIPQMKWTVPRPRPVRYVDSEMAANELQERLLQIHRGRDKRNPLEPEYFEFVTPDLLDGEVPNIGTVQGQRIIEDRLREGDTLFLDNYTGLVRGGRTESGNDDNIWETVQEWALHLRRRRINVVLLHHAGKSGSQLGTSKRTFFLNTVLKFKEPGDYTQADGARFEVHFEKARRGRGGEKFLPFELQLRDDAEDSRGGIHWLYRPLREVREQQAAFMFEDKMSDQDVGKELGISRYSARRLRKKWQEGLTNSTGDSPF